MQQQPMPAAEIELDEAVVRALLRDQHPDLAELSLRLVANGWDNALFRLGDELLVRLPRRAAAADLVAHEQRWLPVLAPRLPLAVPVPVRVGEPTAAYPWRWTISAWIDGADAATVPPADELAAARTLAAFLTALHTPAPPEAPRNPFRGVPLQARAALLEDRLDQLGDAVDAAAIRDGFARALAAPPHHGPPQWLHGDLHPANLLVCDGALVAVIDFGDVCAGDPASDLAVAWMAFGEPGRRALREALRAASSDDDATWTRARGWALALGVAILANSADNPTMADVARRTLRAALG